LGRRLERFGGIAAVAVLVAVALPMAACADEPVKIRPPAVAGSFYPDDPDELAAMVDGLLAEASGYDYSGRLFALVCPHAGYVYSGHVAAESYAALRNSGAERVVVISPSHVEAFPGASVYDGDAYATPLGLVPVDKAFAKNLAAANDRITLSGRGHDHGRLSRGEHALEVQLPFLQRAVGEFTVVPVVMGDQKYETCRALGVALARLIGDDSRTVIVASSDLSHFHSYDDACALDRMVLESIEWWDYYSLSRNFGTRTWEACGGGPIVAAMMASERLGADRAALLKYANSGDVPVGDRERVVGYSAFVFVGGGADAGSPTGAGPELTAGDKKRLLEISRGSVETAVHGGGVLELDGNDTGVLTEALGAFVTLTIDEQLRGCIGYVVPIKPLRETVRDVAAFAAVRDRRFEPVSESELDDLEYEVSVLSPLRRVTDPSEIEVGRHGLLIKKGSYEGLLLPQVASERGWDGITFLEQTCRKAGLPPDAWRDPNADVFAFTALVFDEHSTN